MYHACDYPYYYTFWYPEDTTRHVVEIIMYVAVTLESVTTTMTVIKLLSSCVCAAVADLDVLVCSVLVVWLESCMGREVMAGSSVVVSIKVMVGARVVVCKAVPVVGASFSCSVAGILIVVTISVVVGEVVVIAISGL